MIRSAVLALGLCGAGLASPVCRRDDPTPSTGKGFNLIMDLYDPSKDFDPPIQHAFITTIHVGAGLSKVGTSTEKGPVFFQNGGADAGETTVVTLQGTPPTEAGFKVVADKAGGFSDTSLDLGPGTPGYSLNGDGDLWHLGPGDFFACNEPLEYYMGKKFVVIKQSGGPGDVPEECRPVRLVPQCADLPSLPADAFSNYDGAIESSCYDDVASIKST